ncbi:MAG: rRNA pseudouridine synthase [Ruminococcaceae bacterium]|nr:rRNA pseudouridine synthase [Oscillospiraceae bacterium]
MSEERLDKIIASSGLLTRSEVKTIIKKGLVKVNNITVKDAALKFDCEIDEIEVDGKPLRKGKYVYIMLNKPKGVVSATNDNKDLTVVDILPDDLKRKNLFPAGRLDKDTTGFCLITDDGNFAHDILTPAHHVSKTYIAELSDDIDFEKGRQAFKDGVVLADGTVLLSADLEKIENNDIPTYKVIINEGKYHQVKRMFASLGSTVVELKRIKIGELCLDEKLKDGEARLLTQEELSKITQITHNIV